MTANRALRELQSAGVVVRRAGRGSFIAEPRPIGQLIEIRNIADEVRSRGHAYRARVIKNAEIRADADKAAQMEVAVGTKIFHSVIVHFENDAPIQVEDRWVNPALAPDYMEADFGAITPNEHLMRVAPLQRAEYQIEALLPTADVAEMLAIAQTEPALVLRRRTFSQGAVESVVVLWHPGSRYRFGGALGQAL